MIKHIEQKKLIEGDNTNSTSDEARILDLILFGRDPRLWEWQIDLLRIDFSSLQRAVLKRHLCRGEGLNEVATHIGRNIRTTHLLLNTALEKVRLRSEQLRNVTPIPQYEDDERLCPECQEFKVWRKNRKICDDCHEELK